MDFPQSFRDKALSFGVNLPEKILFDGKIHRFKPDDGSSRGDAGWYVCHTVDNSAYGTFGDWSQDLKENWFSGNKINAETRKAIERNYKDADREERKKNKLAAQEANKIWESAGAASADHPYLVAKGIAPHNARQIDDSLIIPVYGETAEIVSVQSISSDGNKKFTYGSRMRGSWSALDGHTDIIYICEGWSTSATANEATGCLTYVAWNAGNLSAVAQYVQTKHPDSDLVIVSDQDAWDKTGNPAKLNIGQIKGKNAAAACGGQSRTIPVSDDLLPNGKHATDINDWAILKGIGAVKDILSNKSSNVIPFDKSVPAPEGNPNKFSDLNDAFRQMNKRYAVIKMGGTARVADFSKDDISTLKPHDFVTYAGNQFVYVEDEESEKPKKVCVAKKWLEWPGRRTYERFIFKPCLDNIPEDSYNLWRGWAVKSSADVGKFDLFFDHIRVNICAGDEKSFKWVIGWLCDLFQNPCQKIGVALVLRSPEEGTGKGFFATQIGKLLGKNYASYLHADRIVGKFNAHLRDKLLIFMDEAVWAGDKQTRGALYGLITEPTLTVEAKGMMPEESPSYLRVLMASNHDWVAPAGIEARRFNVLDVAPNAQNNAPYFKAIEEQLKKGGYEALLHYFLHTPYDREEIRIPLNTSALLDQKIAGFENEIAWFFEVMNFNKIGEYDLYGLDGTTITTENFYLAYLAWTEKNSIRKPCSRIALARNINKSCGLSKAGIPLASTWAGGAMGNAYKLAAVTAYRMAFEEKIKQPINWEE